MLSHIKRRDEGQNRESRSTTHLKARAPLKNHALVKKGPFCPSTQFPSKMRIVPAYPCRIQFISLSWSLYSTFCTPTKLSITSLPRIVMMSKQNRIQFTLTSKDLELCKCLNVQLKRYLFELDRILII